MLLSGFGTFSNSQISVVCLVVYKRPLVLFLPLKMHVYFLGASSTDNPYLVWTLKKCSLDRYSHGSRLYWSRSNLRPSLRIRNIPQSKYISLNCSGGLSSWSWYMIQLLPAEKPLLAKEGDYWFWVEVVVGEEVHAAFIWCDLHLPPNNSEAGLLCNTFGCHGWPNEF